MKKNPTKLSGKPQTRVAPIATIENPVKGDEISVVLDANTSYASNNKEKSASKRAPTIGQQNRDTFFQLARQSVAEGIKYYIHACPVDLGTIRQNLRRVATKVQEDKARLHRLRTHPMKNSPVIQRCIAVTENSERVSVKLHEATSELYDASQRLAACKTPLALEVGVWLHVLKANCKKSEWTAFLHSVDLSPQAAGKFCSSITKRIEMCSKADPTGDAVKTVYEATLATDTEQKVALWSLVKFD